MTLVQTDKVMLLTKQLHASPAGGRELLCKMNHDILKDMYGERCSVFELGNSRTHGFKSIISALKGYIDGSSTVTIAAALHEILNERINKVFVDGSKLTETIWFRRKALITSMLFKGHYKYFQGVKNIAKDILN